MLDLGVENYFDVDDEDYYLLWLDYALFCSDLDSTDAFRSLSDLALPAASSLLSGLFSVSELEEY